MNLVILAIYTLHLGENCPLETSVGAQLLLQEQ